MAELKIALLAGAESKQFLSSLTTQIDRLEGLLSKTGKLGKLTKIEDDEEVEEVVEVEDDEDFEEKPAKKKKKVDVDFDDAGDEEEPEEGESEESEESEEEVEEEEEAAPPKKGKGKKLTIKDVNDACKKRASVTGGAEGRKEVLAILKKKFKTETVTALKEEQYKACIQAMAIDE